MNPQLKFFSKLFMVFGLSFALGMYLMDVLLFQEPESPGYYVFLFIFFGLCMSLTLGILQMKAISKLGVQNPTDDDFKVNQKRSYTSILPPDQLITKLKADPYFKNSTFTIDDQMVRIQKPISWLSWGEHMSIQWEVGEDGVYKYQVESKSNYGLTLTDGATGLANVLEVQKFLDASPLESV